MIIDRFERNEQDLVVAVCGTERHVLSWDFIYEYKPQVGDVLAVSETGLDIAKQEEVKTEALVAAIEAPVEPVI